MMRKLALLFAVLLIAAACGGSSDDTSSAADPQPATPVTVADDTGTASEGEAAHDDGEAAHDEGEAAHDDETAHDEGEAAHDDEAAHDEGEAAHDEGEAAHDDEIPADVDRVVAIEMAEFTFSPDPLVVSAGETVRFELSNTGVIEHEFRLTTDHAAEEHIAAGHEGHGDEGSSGGHGHDEIVVLVAPGGFDSVDVTFAEAGEFEIVACLIPGHFEAGMKVAVEYHV